MIRSWSFSGIFPILQWFVRKRNDAEIQPLLSTLAYLARPDPWELLFQAQSYLDQAASHVAWFFGRQKSYYRQAADFYAKAGLRFRDMGHCNEYAAHALNIAACLHLAHTERYADAESLFLKIYRIRLRTGLFPAAARSLNQAVYCLALQGQMHAVMTKLVWLGQLYYSELRDHRKAQSTFEKAAVLSEEQKQPRLAEMLWVLIAEIAASYSKDYEKAAICFERAARQNMQSLPIHRHPRANMFKAGLCHLLDRGHGSWRLRLLLDLGFFEIDSTFPGGLEWNILQSIFEALQKRDRGTVDPIVAECKQLSEVDCFAAALLEQI